METLARRHPDDPGLARIADPDALADYLRTGRSALNEQVLQGAGGVAAAAAYSDLVDAVLRRMLVVASERVAPAHPADGLPFAVVATGGYGRRELCPHSDVDVTFIPHRDGDPMVDRVIKEMFTLVMRVFIDANGMDVGYAYRLREDCAGLDHQTASGLMDARLVAGSSRLFIQFESDFWASFNPAEFIFTKMEERRAQRVRAGATPLLVEPNLKEGAGGLRDLQTAVWVTQARSTRTAAEVRGERAWELLARDGRASAADVARLRAAKEFLFRVRNALHVLAGAERDQLVVTRQEEVARALAYGDDGSAPAVERLMFDHYAHAAALDRITDRVTSRIESSRMFLGIGLDCVDKEIVPAGPALEHEDPAWMLWACELAQRYRLEFGEEIDQVIDRLLGAGAAPADLARAGEAFTRILASPRGAYPILQRMADRGILGRLLPEFGAIMHLIPYDPSHDYTVGQHSLFVVRNLDGLRSGDGGEDGRDFRQILSELAHPEQLYLAALLHDAGKAVADRPHSEVGEAMAASVCERLGWDEQASANVGALVRHHLLMAETSRLRDLNLEETIRDFVGVVDDTDRLNMLYLLTYADTNAVGAGVWTQVKARFLRDLHRRAERMLVGETPEDFDDAALARARRRLLKDLSVENLPPDEVAAHVESMPAPYILNTSLTDMALHIGFVRRARQGEPVADFHDERESTFTEVTVCSQDDPEPGLLAKITGVFYAADVDVHSAQVFTRVAGDERIAIDSFYVDYRGRQLTPGKRKEIASNMTAVLTGATTVANLLARRRKPPEIGGPVERLDVRNDLSDTFTVVEVVSPDARGMLYRASGALSLLRWDIHSARVSLFKGRSVGSFYVTGVRPTTDAEARRALLGVMPLRPTSA